MMDKAQKSRWIELLNRECKQREAFRDKVTGGKFDDPSALREWWGTVSEILYAMQNKLGTPPDPMPMELLFVLADTASYLATGMIPSPILDVRARGATGPGPSETRDIRWAVTYRKAAETGLIDDKAPVKTIVEHYKLRSKRTVQEWCEKHQPYGNDEHHGMAVIIRVRMEHAAERYSIANRRTHSAIGHRASKRGELK
jgi:hypothetical protein